MTSSNRSRLHLASRVAAGVLGSYAFVWGFIALGAAFGLLAGLGYEDALQLSSWFGLLVFIASLCAAFATASLLRVWTVLAGGGALMTCAAWLLLRALH
ncbi:MAG TPA: hypothetical protein VJV78_48770 [Polyangiales bacterium]|nr:hypothetical protein [Polyangiales bacterium]